MFDLRNWVLLAFCAGGAVAFSAGSRNLLAIVGAGLLGVLIFSVIYIGFRFALFTHLERRAQKNAPMVRGPLSWDERAALRADAKMIFRRAGYTVDDTQNPAPLNFIASRDQQRVGVSCAPSGPNPAERVVAIGKRCDCSSVVVVMPDEGRPARPKRLWELDPPIVVVGDLAKYLAAR